MMQYSRQEEKLEIVKTYVYDEPDLEQESPISKCSSQHTDQEEDADHSESQDETETELQTNDVTND